MDQCTTLISVEFTRTSWVSGSTPTHVTYRLKKATPVGMLEAHATVEFKEIKENGIESIDGRMFMALGERLNREELSTILEVGANYDFGLLKESKTA